MTLKVLNTKGDKIKNIELDEKVFDGKINALLIQQAVVAYLANQRKGLASAKTRGEVSGGGRKPWRQKGTGRARAGSIRSPLWKKGGVVFGPKPHSFRKDLPKKMKLLAFKSALNAKLKDEEILLLDKIALATPKTKEFIEILNNLNLKGIKTRLVVSAADANIKRASRNISNLDIQTAKSLTTIEVVDCKKIVFTCDAIKEVEERCKEVSL